MRTINALVDVVRGNLADERENRSSRARQALVVPLALTLVACGNGGGPAESSAQAPTSPLGPEQPAPFTQAATGIDGHYRGIAAIGDGTYQYHAEALIGADGAVRLYVGGPLPVDSLISGGGLPPPTAELDVSTLVVGDVKIDGGRGIGQGLIFGQNCAAPHPGRFCDQPAPADISIARTLAGEVRITTTHGEEIWLADLAKWSIYYGSGSGSGADGQYLGPTGTYRERFAQFARAGDVIVTIDSGGRLFFQSPSSGCTGNGTLAPRSGGKYYVFHVELAIASCAATDAFLNGAFEGLATASQNGLWDYDDWLVMFLSTHDGAAAPHAAVTLIAGAVN